MKPQLPAIGKVSSEIFDEIILPRLGRKHPEILMGPRHGREGMRFFEHGATHDLVHPKVDPFWSAFGKAASQGG